MEERWVVGVDEVGRAVSTQRRDEPRPTRWLIGIDEVGRGAIAGPLVIAAVALQLRDTALLDSIRDSKALTPLRREAWDARLRAQGIATRVFSVPPAAIDRRGVSASAAAGVARVLRFFAPLAALALLDGGLVAQEEYRQLTIIRGDAQLPVIAAASIVAKVKRDRIMRRMHERYPQYGFDRHVGYGTAAHYAALRRHGPSPIHRRSFRLA